MDKEIQELLSALPLNTAVNLGDDLIYLNVSESGAELGVRLTEEASTESALPFLKIGFVSAIEFDAGVAYMAHGSGLALTRWLPGVRSWIFAQAALEDLLNQLAVWREWLSPQKATPKPRVMSREEEKMRSLLLGRR